MAKIRKIYDQTIKPDGSKTTIYPITSTRAVFAPDGSRLDKVLANLHVDLPYIVLDSTSDLPSKENHNGYLIGENLYVWVGAGGDTLDGKYQNCGPFRGPSGGVLQPDNEDIRETEQHTLQFADRNNIEGMGYVILRKNKTFAEQVLVANTIYEIRYDFNLDNGDIAIPEGCILLFKGGRLLDANSITLGPKVKILGNMQGEIHTNQIFVNVKCVIDGVKVIRSTEMSDSDSILILDDDYFERGESRVEIQITNCKFAYPIGGQGVTHGYAIELVARGNFTYSGYYDITFSNVNVDGYFNAAFYIHSETGASNGWITDIAFIRCFVERCKIGWLFESHSATQLEEISLISCSMQCTQWSTYAVDIGFAHKVHIIASEFWDWHVSACNPINVHDNTGDVHIDRLSPSKETVGYDLNGASQLKKGKNTIRIDELFGHSYQLERFIDLTGESVSLLDWYNLPYGVYTLPQDQSIGDKLGIRSSVGGVLLVTGRRNHKLYCYVVSSNDQKDNRVVSFMALTSAPASDSVLSASLWINPFVISSKPNNYSIKLAGSEIYFQGRPYATAHGTSLPAASSALAGEVFFDDFTYIPAICDGYSWAYVMTRPQSISGETRPNYRDSVNDRGKCFFDTTLSPARPIWWTGTQWVDATGAIV